MLSNMILTVKSFRLLVRVGCISVVNLLVTGCAPFTTVRTDGALVRHHFGYIRVVTPRASATDGAVEVLEVRSIGARVHRGVGFGYAHERTEYVPLDNRLIVRVANDQQFEHAMRILSPLAKEGLCIVIDR